MATSLNLIRDLAIVRGKTFEKIDLLFPGDKTLWTPRAQIRKKWHYKEPTKPPVIEFAFLPLLYDPDTDKTLVRPRLSAIISADLPVTVYQGKGDPDETNCLVWDLELSEPLTDKVIGLDWGFIQVKPEVTVTV